MALPLHDLRIALRELRKRPAFTTTAVLTLGIGMGVNAVAFGVENGLLFKGFATTAPNGLGRIATIPGGDESGYASLEEYERFAESTRGALALAAEGRSSMAWRHDGTTETAWVLFISSNYFSLVAPKVIAGQLQVQSTPAGPPAVVVGERFWRTKLGSRPLTNLSLRLNGAEVNVAGIIPESFTGPAGIYSPDVWLPLEDLKLFGTSAALQKRDARWLFVMGRMLEGTTRAQVQGQIDTAAALMAREWPDTHKGRGARFRMFGEGNSEIRQLTAGASIAMGIIGLVLLLACFNVANLLLARGVERERDMGIRAALGASPARLMRYVVIEGFVLAAMSGALALVLSMWTPALIGSFAIPIEEPQHVDLAPDFTVVAFVLALVVVAGVLPGVWPSLAAARVNVSRVLGSQGANAVGGRPSPLRRWLVGVQIAGSTVFVAVAMLLIQSYARLSNADVGFARKELVIAEMEPASNGYAVDRAERYVDALAERVRALPGVIDVAIADRVPFFIGFDRQTMVWPEGEICEAAGCPKYATYAVSPGYFRTMGIPLAEGREFEFRRAAGDVVINQAFARKRWPEGGGLGKRFRVGTDGKVVTVVGITARTHTRGLDRESPSLFMPIGTAQFEDTLTIVARTAAAADSLVRPVIEAANAIDPNVSLRAVKSMEQRIEVQLWPFRTLSWMFSICGALAIIMATVGLAGVVIHAVSRRTREFGVRISVGATPRDLVADVLRSSVALLVPGLMVGLLLAIVAARLAHSVFVGVNVMDLRVYLGVAAAQSAIVILACMGPALRTARMDALAALRSD